jgi:hypothetical protein
VILVYIENPLLNYVGYARKLGIDIFTNIYKQSPELFALNYY